MLMSPDKGETTVHGWHCPGDVAVRMREELTRPWVGVCVPLQLFFTFYFFRGVGNSDEDYVELELRNHAFIRMFVQQSQQVSRFANERNLSALY